jgi:hypothetical protein
MFIKLAKTPRCSEIDKILTRCCDHKDARFIPMNGDVFGIAANEIKLSMGIEDSSKKSDTTLLQFVDVYRCAKLHDIDYDPFIPDTKFFRNIIMYCIDQSIKIDNVTYSTNLGVYTEGTEGIIGRNDVEIEKLYLNYRAKFDNYIIINKFGYVDVKDYHEDITNLINAGLS